MFKNILLRSMVGATAVGSALAVSLVATPAVVSSVPEIQNVACEGNYPAGAETSTDVKLDHSIAQYGTANTATATVTSVRIPEGRVRFTLFMPGPDVTSTVPLHGGQASFDLPRTLPAGATYKVTAKYLPACNQYKPSSGTTYYTVLKARTTTDVTAADITRAQKSQFEVTVDSHTLTPSGQLRLALSRGGKTFATQTLRLSHGHVSTSFGKVRPGTYKATAHYLGTKNFRGSSGSDTFHVTNR